MTISSDVRAMVVAGFGREDVIARFGASAAVCAAYNRAVAKPVVRAWGLAGTTAARAKSEALKSDEWEAEWRRSQAIAGIYHLVDLKRAGHSPTRTEYVIPPDNGRKVTVPLRPQDRSLTGSHF